MARARSGRFSGVRVFHFAEFNSLWWRLRRLYGVDVAGAVEDRAREVAGGDYVWRWYVVRVGEGREVVGVYDPSCGFDDDCVIPLVVIEFD